MLSGEELKKARGSMPRWLLADLAGVGEDQIKYWEKGVPPYNEDAVREVLGLRIKKDCLYYGVHTSSGTRFGR